MAAIKEPVWYAVNVGPFVVSEVVTALLRWVLFWTIVYGLCRFLDARGSYRVTLSFFAPLLGITLVTILLDYLSFVVPLPLIRFEVSPDYSPIIGVGQLATAVWIGWISYHFVRLEYRLPFWSAAMVGAFVPLVNTGLFLVTLHLVMPLVPAELAYRSLMLAFNVGFVVAGFLVFLALLRWGRTRLLETNAAESNR